MPEHRYDRHGISPKTFLLEVMWDPSSEMPHRLQAAEALRLWIVHGEFCELDLSYRTDLQEPLQ